MDVPFWLGGPFWDDMVEALRVLMILVWAAVVLAMVARFGS